MSSGAAPPKWKAGDLVWVSDALEAWVPASIVSVDQNAERAVCVKAKHTPHRPTSASPSDFFGGDDGGGSPRSNGLGKTLSWAQMQTTGGETVEVDLSADFENELSGRLAFSETVRGRSVARKKRLKKKRGSGGQPLCHVLPRSAQFTDSKQWVENMDNMVHLHEAAILDNLRQRFAEELIYTSTGPILIAINPYKDLPLYTDALIKQYHAGRPGMLPPHCYTVAEEAFRDMVTHHTNQSLIICGESGAGKTVTTKKMLHYLSKTACSRENAEIAGRVLDSNPIMEAFGNAKTLRNDNSSRFGKFIMVQFGRKHFIRGARVTNYLLEKSRLVRQPKNERNFHVMYQLMAGASSEERRAFSLPPADRMDSFYYINQSGCVRVTNVDDEKEYAIMRKAMDGVGMERAEQNTVLRTLSGVLHLGNLSFRNDGDDHAVALSHPVEAATLLGVDAGDLVAALSTKKITTPDRKVITTPLDKEKAESSRDALAKVIYGRMFNWLVKRLNKSTECDSGVSKRFIGILDIYGFEDLETNGFEQLFISE